MAETPPAPNRLETARRALFTQILVGLALLSAAGVGFHNGWHQVKKEVLVVLAFHGITEKPMWGWEINRQDFGRYVASFLDHDYSALSPHQIEEWRSKSLSGGRRFLVTFDDGLKSSAEAARQLKAERGIPSLLFIVTDFLGKPGYLSSDDLRELASAGIDIGLHGKQHIGAPTLIASGVDLSLELRTARENLEQIVGKPIHWYAYPFGEFSASATAAVASAGLRFAFTIEGAAAQRSDSPFLVPRVMYLRGAEKAGEPVIDDWLPPIEAKNGGLMMTLGFFVLIFSLRFFQRAWIIRQYLAKHEKPA